jgi:radical SAM protein (TIGR04043 family)
MTPSLAAIITEIQSRGVRIPEDTLQRRGGAGPAEAGSLVIGGFAVNVPTSSPYVARSPYDLQREKDALFLFKHHAPVLPVQTVPRPRFYQETLNDGITCQKIALLHGTDCLATSVLQTCAYWNTHHRCRFCGIELSLYNGKTVPLKTPEQLAETAARAKRLDGTGHVVLTTGVATPAGREFTILEKSAQAIKKRTGLPVHAQFMPPRNLEMLERLKDGGSTRWGFTLKALT